MSEPLPPGALLALIEIPKGSRNKYEYDEATGQIHLDRFLSSSTVYPTDYGCLLGHRGEDGDLLDCLVCVSEPTFPGCVIAVNPVALFKMRDEAGVDDKIVCVPVSDPGWSGRPRSRGGPPGPTPRAWRCPWSWRPWRRCSPAGWRSAPARPASATR